MCMARQRAATGCGGGEAVAQYAGDATKIMSMLATVPRPMRTDLPKPASSLVRSSPKGITAAIHEVCSSASFTPMWTRRKTIEATAVVRCTACARMRLRVSSRTRSWRRAPR
ncbi:hypothetical protein SPURM210S_05538 [Streptomyces purpurascens]